MSRQTIKFRVWDKDRRSYRDQDYRDMRGPAVTCAGGVFTVSVPEPAIIELCSGLTDADGRHIYEGDLLSVEDRPGWGYKEVVFRGGQFCCVTAVDPLSTPVENYLESYAVRVARNIHEGERL